MQEAEVGTDQSSRRLLGASNVSCRSDSAWRSRVQEDGGEERRDECLLVRDWKEWKRVD